MITFLLYKEGYYNYGPVREEAKNSRVLVPGLQGYVDGPEDIPKKKDIPKYFEDELSMDCIRFYMNYKKFGNPCDKPWTAWPSVWVDLINMLDNEVTNASR